MRYAQIRSLDISNGKGVGVALFVQGCNLRCENCFNPETWDFSGGKEWTEEVKNKFLELANRPYIKRISILGGEPLAEENIDDVLNLVTEINKRHNTPQDRVYVTDKNNNILMSFPDEFRLLSPQKSIWLYTGFYWEEIFNPTFTEQSEEQIEEFLQQNEIRKNIISKCNVLVDGRYVDSQRDISLKWCGSKNQSVIDIQESLQQGKVVLWHG